MILNIILILASAVAVVNAGHQAVETFEGLPNVPTNVTMTTPGNNLYNPI